MTGPLADRSKEKRGKFLQLMFQGYYRENPDVLDIPDRVASREFGLESWDYYWRCLNPSCNQEGSSFRNITSCPTCKTGIRITKWRRHLGFRSGELLLNEILSSAPHSVYHSAAFYEVPTDTMERKGWQGAELIFDIDADHLSSPCGNDHDSWMCNNPSCRATGIGLPPKEECPRCGHENGGFTTRKWLCERCLEDAKKNTMKLYDDFLVGDFGFNPDLIQLNYSGHRGYHLRVRDPRVFKMSSEARMEIVHYITGGRLSQDLTGDSGVRGSFDTEKVILSIDNVNIVPSRDLPGWAGRTADAMIEFIRDIDSYPSGDRWVKDLRDKKRESIEGLLDEPPRLSAKGSGVGLKSWQEVASAATAVYGGGTDVPVTTDIHRVIRLIGSINGKTGFSVAPLTRDALDDFNPFSDATVFNEGELKVRVASGSLPVPKIWINDTIYGPYLDEVVELPMAAAMFLLCKEVATIA